jgi:hypothetical protein
MKLAATIIALSTIATTGHAAEHVTFDLQCAGEGVATNTPVQMTFSIDLSRGLAFLHGSSQNASLLVTPTKLIITQGPMVTTINRTTGDFEGGSFEGKCALRPYTGMLPQAF